VAEAAKEPTSAGERPLVRARLTDQAATEEEKGVKGAVDSALP
jgi:hypothetical protein